MHEKGETNFEFGKKIFQNYIAIRFNISFQWKLEATFFNVST